MCSLNVPHTAVKHAQIIATNSGPPTETKHPELPLTHIVEHGMLLCKPIFADVVPGLAAVSYTLPADGFRSPDARTKPHLDGLADDVVCHAWAAQLDGCVEGLFRDITERLGLRCDLAWRGWKLLGLVLTKTRCQRCTEVAERGPLEGAQSFVPVAESAPG